MFGDKMEQTFEGVNNMAKAKAVVTSIGVPKSTYSSTKDSRPKRNEFELEELGDKLEEARESGNLVRIVIWKRDEPLIGRVTELNSKTGRIHVQERYGDERKIPFADILSVQDVEE